MFEVDTAWGLEERADLAKEKKKQNKENFTGQMNNLRVLNYEGLIPKEIWVQCCISRTLNMLQLACQLCLTGSGFQVVPVLSKILSLVRAEGPRCCDQ